MVATKGRGIRQSPIVGDARGQALVEAAMTMLLLLVFIFAIFEAGRYLQVQQALTDAAREGARRAVAPYTRTDTLLDQAGVDPFVQSYLEAASIHGALVRVDHGVTIGGSTTSYCRVTVTYDYHVMTTLMFGSLNMTLTGQSLMREETSQ